jgi:2-polyprenyl-3-methyl-5-hydroxy-6-metoxy-1,4-benzoquinol methylase
MRGSEANIMEKEDRTELLSKYERIFKSEENYYDKRIIHPSPKYDLEDEQFFRKANVKFKSMLGDMKGKKILDIGCGKGNLSFYLAKMGADVIGIDLSKNFIDFCRREFKNTNLKLEFKVMNAQIPDFEENTFDMIVGSRTIHHLPDLGLFFKECHRLLKEKGYIVFIEPLKKNPIVELNRKYFAPKCRTKHEHPLRMSDVMKAKTIFGNIQHHEYFLISPFAMVLLRLIKNSSLYKTSYKVLNFIEKPLYKIKFLRDYCWQIVFKCIKN